MLSDRAIRNAKPGTYYDRLGLYLRVYPASKTFIYRDRRGGKDQWITLGHYPTMSLAQARQEALERKHGAPEGAMTLQAAWDAFYKQLQKQYRRPEIARERMGMILPTLGARRLASITRAEVSTELQKIVDRGSPVMANRVLAVVKAVWRYAIERGWLEASPVELLTRRAVGGRETPRRRTLDWTELEAFLRFLRSTDHDMAPGTRWALYLCLLAGVRASEALEVLATGRLVLEDTKSGRAHRIPSTPAIRAALRLAKPHPIPQDHRVLSKALRRAEQTFTPHDLRRTFASRLADLGVMPHVIEKLLNHQMEGVMAVYNRAEYWPERVAAQVLWGQKLAQLRKKPPPV